MLRMVLPCCAGIPISLKRADVVGEVGVTGCYERIVFLCCLFFEISIILAFFSAKNC